MYLTGQVDQRTLEKYEREAKEKNRETWYLSWALDTNIVSNCDVYICSYICMYTYYAYFMPLSLSLTHTHSLS